MIHTSQNQREDIFYLPHPLPPGQNRFKQFPNPGPEEQNLSRGLPGENGVVTGQIEPCISTSEVVFMYLRVQLKKLSLALRYSRMINFIHHSIHLYFPLITQRWPT